MSLADHPSPALLDLFELVVAFPDCLHESIDLFPQDAILAFPELDDIFLLIELHLNGLILLLLKLVLLEVQPELADLLLLGGEGAVKLGDELTLLLELGELAVGELEVGEEGLGRHVGGDGGTDHVGI